MGSVVPETDAVRQGTAAGTPTSPPRGRLTWRRLLLVTGVLVLLAALVGAVAGWRAAAAGQGLPSPDQRAVLDEFGVPLLFALSEFPVDGASEGLVRLERWGYPEQELLVVFLDGIRAADGPLPVPDAGWPDRPDRVIDPTLLHHDLAAEEVDALLGPPAAQLPGGAPHDTGPLPPDLHLRYHPETDVLIAERDGHLISAQTLGVAGS